MPPPALDGSDWVVAAVSEAWSRALGIESLRADDDFFALGGHSLLVLEVVDDLEETTGVAIPLRFFFENPQLSMVADYVSKRRQDA